MRTSSSEARPTEGGALTLWVLWLTYGSFYFCRTNLSAAIPGIEAELELSKTQIGFILGSLKLTYGFGQFLNGQLAERISARKLLAIGMLGSAGLNVAFGFGTALYFLVFVWACNGYFQSLGWPPCMRVAANWFPASTRGKSIGIIGTGYQATAALTFVVSGFAVTQFGWRGALYIPAAMFAAACIHMLIFLKDSPPDQEPSVAESQAVPTVLESNKLSVKETVLLTISNPALWLLAVSLGLLNACRYGFLDWGLPFLVETQNETVQKAALKYAILPIGGIAGSLVAGWMTDRFFQGRRAPMVSMLLLVLGVLALVFHRVVETGLWPSLIILTLVGFTIYGPQVLLVGTAPIDLARKGTAAAAVGFVNFMGYMGAFCGDQITGMLADYYSWSAALTFWAGCAFGAALISAFLWKASSFKIAEEK